MLDPYKTGGLSPPSNDAAGLTGQSTAEHVTCPSCAETKPRSAYNRNKARPNGLQSQCRSCEAKARSGCEPTECKARWLMRPEVEGRLGEEALTAFAEAFSDLVKELHDDGALKEDLAG